eukprot:GFUD01030562.1.p1 GENE.GFUD01030562.1~~GFUD01030562.1.p1  ORF type:complete len:552 (-),score=125.52 GFUD01030562.1:302-1957(-)
MSRIQALLNDLVNKKEKNHNDGSIGNIPASKSKTPTNNSPTKSPANNPITKSPNSATMKSPITKSPISKSPIPKSPSPKSPSAKRPRPLLPIFASETETKKLKLSPVKGWNSETSSHQLDTSGLFDLSRNTGDEDIAQSRKSVSNNLAASSSTSPVVTAKVHPAVKTVMSADSSSVTGRSSGDHRQLAGLTSPAIIRVERTSGNEERNKASGQPELSGKVFIQEMSGFRSTLPVLSVLDSTKFCSVVDRDEMEILVARKEVQGDDLVRRLRDRMAGLMSVRKFGLSHWGGEVKWTALGDKEMEEPSESFDWKEWTEEKVGIRTRAATRQRPSYMGSEDFMGDKDVNDAGVFDYDESDSEEQEDKKDEYDEVDGMGISRKVTPRIDDDEDDKDWYSKTPGGKGKKGKGRPRGKGRKFGGAVRKGDKKAGSLSNNPGVYSYLDTVNNNTEVIVVPPVTGKKVMTMPKEAANVEITCDDDFEEMKKTVKVSPVTAICNRLLLTRQFGSADPPGCSASTRGRMTRSVTEETGSCPLCQKVMRMKVLEEHASTCQG